MPYKIDAQDLKNAVSPSIYYGAELTDLKKRKKEGTACCPFHDDNKPSLSVNLETGVFYCHACGETGPDIIDFCQKKYSLNFQNALNQIANDHASELLNGETPRNIRSVTTPKINEPKKEEIKEEEPVECTEKFIADYFYTDEHGEIKYKIGRRVCSTI